MLKPRILLLLLSLLLGVRSYGQDTRLGLEVRDAETEEFLQYVNLYLQSSGVGTTTNSAGKAALQRPASHNTDTLVVSFVGYQTQRIPLTKRTGQRVTVQLARSEHVLDEVVVRYKKPLKPIQILRKALQRTEENYPTHATMLTGLLRETVQENGRYIQLNEAITKLHYTAYPQKSLDSKIWEDWYYDQRYAFDLDANRVFAPLLKDFNTKQDQQQLLATRSSDNLSQHGLETALIGGPLLLTALDKLKYQYDFLRPGNFSRYNYTTGESVYLNGTSCYAIRFQPKPTNKRFQINQSRKNKSAIYSGWLYIEKETFAVVRFEYQLAVHRNYGFFSRRMPLSYLVTVNYAKEADRWNLSTIVLEETRKVGTDATGNSILHTGLKELRILSVEPATAPIADSLTYKSTRHSAIRFVEQPYDQAPWDQPHLKAVFPLPEVVRNQLETQRPLKAQFAARFQYQKALPAPTATRAPYIFDHEHGKRTDSLHWMALPTEQMAFKNYLLAENKYASNALLADRKYQRKLFEQLSGFYVEREPDTANIPMGAVFFDEDTLGQQLLFERLATGRKLLLNITAFQKLVPNTVITRIVPNAQRQRVLVGYEKAGVIGSFSALVNVGNEAPTHTLDSIYSIEWHSDSTVAYSHINERGRGNELVHLNLTTGKRSVLLTESDPTFDIRLEQQGEALVAFVESKSENECYVLGPNCAAEQLTPVVPRAEGVTYSILKSQRWYLLTSKNAPNNALFESESNRPFAWQPMPLPGKNSYLQELTATQHYLVATTLDKGLPLLQYLKRGTTRWQKYPFKPGIGSYQLGAPTNLSDTVQFSFSAPNRPHGLYKWAVGTESVAAIRQDSVRHPHALKYIATEQHWAKSADGTNVPMTLASSRAPIRKHQGVILKVYGAYGAITTPGFSAQEAILMQHGYTIAYAHVRGEAQLGNDWYTNGKLDKKHHSFEDYIACAQQLIRKKITVPEQLVAYGNSAGGLVVGRAINTHPELFNTAILDHAYLDVLTTMTTDSLPLTIDEYKEWGNPRKRSVFEYIQAYSPYQNIRKQAYPNVLLTASYLDYQTPAWQIAKHAAALRANNTSSSRILLVTDMNSGHAGNTNNNAWIRAFAEEFSFVKMCVFGAATDQ